MKKYIILIPIYNDTDSASQLIKNIDYEIIEPKKSKPIIKSYADNFLS